ncbi:MAG TPA: hypothetical protein PLF01_03370 [Alphaproteobacteria bacterium]|nr:hypothetical protein [Alphaproteobacteria bacterium]
MAIFKRRRRNRTQTSGADAGQMLNLSLFIMLLAFFIVLNSLSSYEELKTEQVRRSVELAFAKDPKIQPDQSSARKDPAQALKEGHTFDRIDALFESEIMSFEATSSKSLGIMMVRVPYEKFSKAIMATGQKDLLQYPSRKAVRGNFFLPTLVSILRRNIDGAPTRMEIMVHTEENPAMLQNQQPKKMMEVMSKVGVFSQRLEKQGMPEKLLNIGVSKGDPEYIDLVFRKYIPFSPTEVEVPQ